MSKEKQIEEMARDIFAPKVAIDGIDIAFAAVHGADKPDSHFMRIAQHLYNAGYRKQSENTIVLPCKVGDLVYVPWRWGGQRAVATVRVEEIKFYDSQMHYMFLIDMESDNECFNQSFGGWKTDKCIGKTVFLTKEEAEAKMKGGV